MTAVLLSAPAVEPITLSEAKTHLRVDSSSEDALIQSLIMASRLHIEAALDLALITQTWRLRCDTWPSSRTMLLPLRPIQNLIAVRIYDETGTSETLSLSSFILDGAANPARIVWRGDGMPPVSRIAANGIEIELVAGHGDAPGDVPQSIRQALLLLITHWYENREPVEIGASGTAIPGSVSELLAPYRRRRL